MSTCRTCLGRALNLCTSCDSYLLYDSFYSTCVGVATLTEVVITISKQTTTNITNLATYAPPTPTLISANVTPLSSVWTSPSNISQSRLKLYSTAGLATQVSKVVYTLSGFPTYFFKVRVRVGGQFSPACITSPNTQSLIVDLDGSSNTINLANNASPFLDDSSYLTAPTTTTPTLTLQNNNANCQFISITDFTLVGYICASTCKTCAGTRTSCTSCPVKTPPVFLDGNSCV